MKFIVLEMKNLILIFFNICPLAILKIRDQLKPNFQPTRSKNKLEDSPRHLFCRQITDDFLKA